MSTVQADPGPITASESTELRGIERLVLEMARAYNWVSLYQAGHSSLEERVGNFHREMVERISREPSGRLLLGIAKDRFLYRDRFLGNGNPLVQRFVKALFLQQVATLDLSAQVSRSELISFFLCLQKAVTDGGEAALEGALKEAGVRGIGLHRFNYKEILSRRITDADSKEPPSRREDDLWRMMLTENVSAGTGDPRADDGFSVPPELVAVFLRRAHPASRGNGSGAGEESIRDLLSQEMMQRIMAHLGDMFRKLPLDGKLEILRSIEADDPPGAGSAGGGGGFPVEDYVRALAGGNTDDDFLDILAAVITAEGKGGQRLRKIFSTITPERNRSGSLLSMVRTRLGESLRTKNHVARRAWEAVETLLLERSEDAYLGRDHSGLLEGLPVGGGAARAGKREAAAIPGIEAEFEERNLHRKNTSVLLEILAKEESEGDFLGLLEEVRKVIPNIISWKEFRLLQRVLSDMKRLEEGGSDSRKNAVRGVIGELDFAYMLDLYLSPALFGADRGEVEEILVSSLELSIGDFLDRLLMESDNANRRALLSLASRFDQRALPKIRERLSEPQWYFVRNLCTLLGEIGGDGTALDLIRLLAHKDQRVRREAILALGKLEAKEAVPALGEILLQGTFLGFAKEDPLQIEAANALFRCGGTRAASYLHRGTRECRQKVRQHCSILLRTLEGRK